MTIRKAYNRFSRILALGNNISSNAGNISTSKITSGGFDYYVYTSPANDSFVTTGISTSSRVIKGGTIGAGSPFGNADVLVVAGGGGGGGGDGMGQGGGGGAGGVRYFPNIPVPSSPVPIQVGTGGVPTGSYSDTVSGNGQPSFFGPSYISYGGGGAGSGDRPGPSKTNGRKIAGQGGSGGGSGTWLGIGPYAYPAADPQYTQAGLGNIPPFSPPQGSNGGGNTTNNGAILGGGGGASGIGGTAFPAPTNAAGGNGAPYPAFPAPILAPVIPAPLQPRWIPSVSPTGLFGGGGGGGVAPGPNPAAVPPGGSGGGGNGGNFPGWAGQPGVTYTGGGGGGGLTNGGQGGTGIIIIRKAI